MCDLLHPVRRVHALSEKTQPDTGSATGYDIRWHLAIPSAATHKIRVKPLTEETAPAILAAMNTSGTGNVARDPDAMRQDTIGGVLAAAVNMEEDIGAGVYQDYLRRQNWPEQLDENAFAEIRKRLTVLTKDIERHKRIIDALVREHVRDK
jgi:hypothetical protein